MERVFEGLELAHQVITLDPAFQVFLSLFPAVKRWSTNLPAIIMQQKGTNGIRMLDEKFVALTNRIPFVCHVTIVVLDPMPVKIRDLQTEKPREARSRSGFLGFQLVLFCLF